MSGITLHRKFGLCPTMPICFWCDQEKGEIALLGNKWKSQTEEPPKHMVLDYEPCDTCKANRDKGIVLMEATKEPMVLHQPPIREHPPIYPTGRWAVVTEEFVTRIFDAEMAKGALEHRGALVDPEAAAKLGLFEKEIQPE